MISSVVLTVVLLGGAVTGAEYRQWRNIITCSERYIVITIIKWDSGLLIK
jgi:hypothetical protein